MSQITRSRFGPGIGGKTTPSHNSYEGWADESDPVNPVARKHEFRQKQTRSPDAQSKKATNLPKKVERALGAGERGSTARSAMSVPRHPSRAREPGRIERHGNGSCAVLQSQPVHETPASQLYR